MRAGDIEKNPGPDKCHKCQFAIRKGTVPMKCNGCKSSYHAKCTNLKRYHREQNEPFICNTCLGAADGDLRARADHKGLICFECNGYLRAEGGECKICCKVVHKKCMGISSRKLIAERNERNDWTCDSCVKFADLESKKGNQFLIEKNLIDVAHTKEGKSDVIKILQWNSDHMMAKIPEIEHFLEMESIDIAVIQESKLRSEDRFNGLANFNMIRADRNREGMGRNARGGGLVTLVKKGIAYQTRPINEYKHKDDNTTEMLAIQIRLHNDMLNLLNIYIPPKNSSVNNEEAICNSINKLPNGEKWLICGDYNGHHELWDNIVSEDRRGKSIANWVEDNNFMILNDGNPTRIERGTSRKSSPDITMCHEIIQPHVSWKTVNKLNSDHLPIIIEYNTSKRIEAIKNRLVWKWKEAKWPEYEAEIESKCVLIDTDNVSTKEVEKELRKVILAAAYKWIGMKQLRTRNGEVFNEDIKRNINERDELMKDDTIDWDKIKEKEENIKNKIKECKAEVWKSKVKENNSVGKMWDLLKCLKGCNGKTDKDAILVYDGKGYISRKSKANAFIKEYAKVSNVKIPKEYGNTKKLIARKMRATKGAIREEEQDISQNEVIAALNDMKGNKAAGPDHIHPRLLKYLPTKAVEIVTIMMNKSLEENEIPHNWRQGKIIPLLKKDKAPESISSYRPICLTSCFSKWMERILNKRIMYTIENNNLLSESQAGFRSHRSVEDQLIRLSQEISDGFHNRQKTTMALLDYAKAYDKVWKDGLISKMYDMGIGSKIIRWVQTWLSNREAWVDYDGVEGKRKKFKQGLPQGSVLSPTLFLIYINDVTEVIPRDAKISMFADDIAVWVSHSDRGRATEILQEACTNIYEWSKKWVMTLSIEKCETCLFTNDNALAEATIDIVINNTTLKSNKNPTFLGITYDTKLNFRNHVQKTLQKGKSRNKILSAISNTEWGCDKNLLRMTYESLTRSCIEYGSPAWMPWLCDTEMQKLERVQLEAARRITGNLASTPTEAVLKEANLQMLKSRSKTAEIIAVERSYRCEDENPRKVIMEKRVNRRLKKKELRKFAVDNWNKIFVGSKNEWRFPRLAKPWARKCKLMFDTDGEKTEDKDDNKVKALAKLSKYVNPDLTVYTDGSAGSSKFMGGAASIITKNESVIMTIKKPAGKYCSSYQTEMVAIDSTMEWLTNNKTEWQNALIITDSKSSIDSIKNFKYNSKNNLLQAIHKKFETIVDKQITFVWVPSHCGIPGNELADKAAEDATKGDQEGVNWLFDVAKARCRSCEETMPITHDRCKELYMKGKINEEAESMIPRKEMVSLRRMRIGHSLELKAYSKRIGKADDDLCRGCIDSAEDTEHLLTCPATFNIREKFDIHTMDDLVNFPNRANMFWKAIKVKFKMED